MIAERTALAVAEDRNVKKRKTAAAMRADIQEPEVENDSLKELDQERRALTARLNGRALKVFETLHLGSSANFHTDDSCQTRREGRP